MFEDIPERLADAVRRIPESLRETTDLRYTAAAGLVIVQFLRQIPTGAEANTFFDFKRRHGEGTSYERSMRIMFIGETLFLLRSQPGFMELCRRFQDRDFRSTFYELVAARSFLRSKFEIHAKPETGIKKLDFDFTAISRSGCVNAEVTALTTTQ
jgi:hypothetical protein